MSGAPYISAEDSALLRRVAEKRSGRACLEMGAGNGGTLKAVAASFAIAVGTDIRRPGMSDWRDAGADYVLADRATCFRPGTFDLVLFNPPYVPSEAVEDAAVDAGPGAEVPMAFLSEALRAAGGDGTVLMVLEEEDEGKAREACLGSGFELARVSEERMFFETLVVCEARKAPLSG